MRGRGAVLPAPRLRLPDGAARPMRKTCTMATRPEPGPNRIEPQSPPEIVPDDPFFPGPAPLEAPDVEPDTVEPSPQPDEWPENWPES